MDNVEFERRVAKLESQLERQSRSSRRTLLLTLVAVASGVPLASRALGPIKTDFAKNTAIHADEINTNFDNLRSAVDALERAPKQPPVGTIVSYAGQKATLPAGWLLCDGRGLAATAYPDLYSALQTAWGDGSKQCSGACDFNLPDLRGVFLRGVDDGRRQDPDADTRAPTSAGGNMGDNVGSIQAGAVGPHLHYYDYTNGGVGGPNAAMLTGGVGQTNGLTVIKAGGPDIGAETRPTNAYVYFIIKS